MINKGVIHHVLGLMVIRDRVNKQLTLVQPDYIKNVLVRFRMENCNSVSTPLESGKQFRKFMEGDQSFDRQIYQQAISCLTYVAMKTKLGRQQWDHCRNMRQGSDMRNPSRSEYNLSGCLENELYVKRIAPIN